MSRVLALWRFRRAVAAVRCTLFLEAKMRRLRALRQVSQSVSTPSSAAPDPPPTHTFNPNNN